MPRPKKATPAPSPRLAVERALVASAEKLFRASTEVNSVLMCVAQYYCDEAEDAVHASITTSKRSSPLPGDLCESKLSAYRALPWDDNDPALILAFEGYCEEDAEEGGSYLPYAIVRRSGGFERVGRLLRPWKEVRDPLEIPPSSPRERELLAAIYASPGDDAPRAVLADWWLSQEDPRGELVQLHIAGELDAKGQAKLEALLEAHSRKMFGEIEPALLLDSAVLRRGFLAEAEVQFPSESAARELSRSLQWGTVERLHFLPKSHQALPPAMGAIRALSGLSKAALTEAAASGQRWPVEDLAVDCTLSDAAKILSGKDCFPRLTRLEGDIGRNKSLATLAKKLPDSVKIIAVADIDEDSIGSLCEPLPPGLCFELASRDELGRRVGFRLQITREGARTRLRVLLDNLLAAASLADVRRVRHAIKGEVDVELVPSRYLDPRPEDLATIESTDEGAGEFDPEDGLYDDL